MDRGVTIKEIAARAEVSTATVSNVIHGKTKRVSPETIRRVQELVQEMGYVQAGGSGKIKGRGSRLIALLANPHKIYEDAIGADPFYGKIIGMVEQCLREKGYYMMFYSSSDMDDIFRMVMVQEVEGVITLSFNKNDCDKIAGLLKRPVVSIDAYGHQGNVPNVGLDDWQGGYDMTNYLLECGYGPVYVCAGRDHGVDHVRYMGCKDAERSAGKGTRQVCFTPLGMDRDRRRVSFETLLRPVQNNIREGLRPALFCLSDLYALEALNYYTARKISVPENLGIAGFDDIFYASLSSPGLTTIRQDMKRKAEMAVERLTGCLEGHEETFHGSKEERTGGSREEEYGGSREESRDSMAEESGGSREESRGSKEEESGGSKEEESGGSMEEEYGSSREESGDSMEEVSHSNMNEPSRSRMEILLPVKLVARGTTSDGKKHKGS